MVVVAIIIWLAAQFGYLPDVLQPAPSNEQPGATSQQYPQRPAGPIRVLDNVGFTIGYDETARRPLWVRYRISQPGPAPLPPRPDFRPDPRLRDDAQPRRIPRSHDRGHLAPNYLITKLYGPRAQEQSFYFSNIAAQQPRFNQLSWQRLEEIEADWVARRTRHLEVTLGPVYSGQGDIPDSFYRIWYEPGSPTPSVMAFLLPQDLRGDEALTDFLTTVDAVEQATGLDFFASLPDEVEGPLESAASAPELWNFEQRACSRARYHGDWQGRDGIDLEYDRCG
jgi:endonuclease G